MTGALRAIGRDSLVFSFFCGGGGVIISLVVREQNTPFFSLFLFLQVLSVAQRKLSERATKQQDAIVRVNCEEVLTWF